jgi:uncharacterized protein YkwD
VRLWIGALTATFVFAGTAQAIPAEAWQLHALDGLGAGVRAQINRVRADRGLSRLRASRPLHRAAAQHLYEMAVLGYFSHRSPNRASVAARLADYYPWRGYDTWHVGETLLWWQTPLSPRAIVRLWLNSPEHRRQLLDARFRDVGVDAVEVHGAGGVFGGRRVTLIGADFGVRY